MRTSTRSIRSKALATIAVGGLLVAAVSALVFSAFSSTTRIKGNTFQAGSIKLSDSSQGSALFRASGMKPGDVLTKCVKVSYASVGNLKSAVRLYGTTTGGGLDRFLTVTVTRGSFPQGQPEPGECFGFTPDATGATVFSGSMSAFPTSWQTGTADRNPQWANGDSAVYRVEVALADDDQAQGLDAAQELVWEARTA